MLGEVKFAWRGSSLTAILEANGRWNCDGSASMASLLNRLYFVPAGLSSRRREEAARVQLRAVADRFGGIARIRRRPRRFPFPRMIDEHPAYVWLGDQAQAS